VERFLLGGQDVLLGIDVQGADTIRRHIAAVSADDPLRRAYTDVFVAPPSVEELRRRLVNRGKDSTEVIDRRVRQASSEMERCGDYRYLVVNDDLDDAYAVLKAILVAEHARTGATPCA
jgi:guanylate kinase